MVPKRVLFQVHKYGGLGAALFILAQALSGILLVLRRGPGPAGLTGEAPASGVSPGDVLATLAAAHPQDLLQRLVFPDRPEAPFLAHLWEPDGTIRYVALDPGTAHILRDGPLWRFPAEILSHLHDQMLAGRPGTAAIILVGLVTVATTLAGVAHWWPRPGRWRQSLTVQWRQPARLVLRQAHRTLGAVAALLVGVSALSGLTLAVPMLLDAPPPPSSPTTIMATDVDTALASARALFPGHAVRDLRFPGPKLLDVYFHAPERNAEAVHKVRIDLADQHVVQVVAANDDHAAWVVVLPLHTGVLGGGLGRALALFSGLSLAMMAVTGPAMWLQLALAKARNRRRQMAGAPSNVARKARP
ncbi:PepSY-associated TM helix domain-containing protein [Nitrospirillum sp. BR 11163]|uniref:PepSY-associated TM helix domain-containing protein n=1 Tax=Nitrospirillum sp. BR 11163 TaxID=3104323 RepID=UPI002AFE4D8A|nr:PepSY-associated TM helix domain-containing protein [Nitrospirillum sp. BR 11163]MEA1671985.1 PepSY-associated TM helix domain-containing protein [Nitrospirillum sp. BR 11163]